MLAFRQKSTVFSGHAVLRCFSCFWFVDKILVHVSSWALTFSEIKMLLHPLMTYFLIFIIFVIKSMFAWLIFHLAFVTYRILEIVHIGPRCFFAFFDPEEVWFLTKTKRYFVKFIIWAGLFCLVLDWDLLLNFCDAAIELKSLIFRNWILIIAIWNIIRLRGIARDWWRAASLKVHMSLREPC